MTSWRFGENAEDVQDGEAWLKQPELLSAYVEYAAGPAEKGTWRRIMVVTKAWLVSHLEGVKHTHEGPLSAVLPVMIVLPDAEGEDLRRVLDTVMQRGGLDDYSTPVELENQAR